MRTVEIWQKKILPKKIQSLFPPRIQRDLRLYSAPEMPEIPESMYIYGDHCVGKTIYSAWILLQEEKRLYLENIPGQCIFVGTVELFHEIKKTFEESNRTNIHTSDVLEKYKNVHLLVLDDFGTMKPTDWVFEILYLLINYRYEHMKTTIFTSNFSLQEIETMLGDSRITSRIERMGQVKRKAKLRK